MKIGRHGYPRLVRGAVSGMRIRVRSWEEHRAVLRRERWAAGLLIASMATTGLIAVALLIAIALKIAAAF